MTGRGLGNCAVPMGGRGVVRGGMGWRGRSLGMGLGRGLGRGLLGNTPRGAGNAALSQDEGRALRQEVGVLENELQQLRARLDELS